MASKYNRKKLNKPPQGEPWIWLSQSMMTSEAFRKLRFNSRRLLDFLMNEHMNEGGLANGRLVAPYKQLEKFGLTKRKISDAINQCEQLGFIEVSRGGRIANVDTFALATLVTRHWVGGAVAGIGIWVNSRLLKDLNFIISDALALFLVAVLLLALLIAWRRRSPGWWCLAGLVLAALALTKAAFLYYAAVLLPLLAVAGIVAVRRRPVDTVRFLTCAALFLGAFSLPTGAWMQRNADIDGRFAITEMNRAAIVLGTREIFNDFTPAQYAASFVHWTRGFGDNLARALFEPKVWKPFELDNPNGFYNTAVRRSSERAQLLIRERGLSANEAHRAVADEQIAAILSRPVIHALTTLPVIYRGIWADEFALFSFPLLVACLWISVKQRRWDIVLILSPGLFNLIFYALISYNIPRYQTTAAPDLSLALAVGVMALLAYLGRQPNAGPLPGAHPNRHP